MRNHSIPTPKTEAFPRPAVGVTGSRTVPGRSWETIEREIWLCEPFYQTLIWGGCIGVDVVCAEYAEMFSLKRHAVLPPNRHLVAVDWPDWATSHEEIPNGPDGYKRRNQRIVDLSDRLIAFPLYPEDHPQSQRSGTWQTIRMGLRKGIMANADIHVLSQIARR